MITLKVSKLFSLDTVFNFSGSCLQVFFLPPQLKGRRMLALSEQVLTGVNSIVRQTAAAETEFAFTEDKNFKTKLHFPMTIARNTITSTLGAAGEFKLCAKLVTGFFFSSRQTAKNTTSTQEQTTVKLWMMRQQKKVKKKFWSFTLFCLLDEFETFTVENSYQSNSKGNP